MPVDEFIKSLILQLPNFAGLLICIVIELKVILLLWDDNRRKQNRIDELCGDKTPGEIDNSP